MPSAPVARQRTRTHKYIYIHTHTHTQIHTYTHTHTRTALHLAAKKGGATDVKLLLAYGASAS